MKHFTTPEFWNLYAELPENIRSAADKSYRLMVGNPSHPSIRLKPVGIYWSARITLEYRALSVRDGDDLIWFWIGHHHEYDRLIK